MGDDSATQPTTSQDPEVDPRRMRSVVAASAAGTVFEWYDFFIFAILTSIISRHFYVGLPDAQAFIFTLLTFAVGFIVRPLGALILGTMGDTTGRQGPFLITTTITGLPSVAIRLLPYQPCLDSNVLPRAAAIVRNLSVLLPSLSACA